MYQGNQITLLSCLQIVLDGSVPASMCCVLLHPHNQFTMSGLKSSCAARAKLSAYMSSLCVIWRAGFVCSLLHPYPEAPLVLDLPAEVEVHLGEEEPVPGPPKALVGGQGRNVFKAVSGDAMRGKSGGRVLKVGHLTSSSASTSTRTSR